MNADLVIAVDLGGTKVEAAAVTADGEVLAATRHRRPTGQLPPQQLAQNVREVVANAVGDVGAQRVAGVAIASAGPIDATAGTVSPVNLVQWQHFPLRDVVASVSPDGVPVTFARDGTAIACAAHWLGPQAARESNRLMAIVISTGIGGGLILDGRAQPGNSGHIGQTEISGFTGIAQNVGSLTNLEAVAAGPSIVAWASAQGWTGTTGEELGASYRDGDPIAEQAIARCAAAVGQALGNASALLDLDVVVVDGGFSFVADDLVDRIQQVVAAHPLEYVARLRVLRAGLPGTAPLVGAAALVWKPELLPQGGA